MAEIKLTLHCYEDRSKETYISQIDFVLSGNSYDEGKVEVTMTDDSYKSNQTTAIVDLEELVKVLTILKSASGS